MQTLPAQEETCVSPRKTQLRFHNNCGVPVHVWRQDSSVDKATVLADGGVFGEALRNDWRSGTISYRLSKDGSAPYSGNAISMLSYWHQFTDKGVTWKGHTYNTFAPQEETIIAGWRISMAAFCQVPSKAQDAADEQGLGAGDVEPLNKDYRWNLSVSCGGNNVPTQLTAYGDVYLCKGSDEES
jgi:hypothetical protein